MINESSGAATKDTRSVYEGHEVYEELLCCTKSSRAATKELQGSYEYNENSGADTKDTRNVDEGHEVYKEHKGCYEND